MAPRTVKRSKPKRKGGVSSIKRKPKGENQKGGSSMKRKPRRKNQKGGFIFNPGFIRNNPFIKLMDNTLDYERRKQRAKKRGKKFKKEKTTDHVWQFVEKKLG